MTSTFSFVERLRDHIGGGPGTDIVVVGEQIC